MERLKQKSERNREEMNYPLLLGRRTISHLGLLDVRNTFLQVSDPSSPKYGHYLSQEEVTALVAPPRASLQTVVQWLQEKGCPDDGPEEEKPRPPAPSLHRIPDSVRVDWVTR